MSLSVTLGNAVSGLQVAQAALQVTSNNVANANTDGYRRKVTSQEAIVVAGIGSGARLSGIERQVDGYLVRHVRGASADVGAASVEDAFFKRMQDMFGSPGSQSSVAASIDKFATGLQALAATPESSSARFDVVASGQALARQLNSMSGDIQQLRAEADQQITSTLNSVNTELAKVADLNQQIARLNASRQSTADLEDQRDLALDRLSDQIGITYFTRDTGEVVVMSPAGRTLLDGTPPTLTHSPASSMSAAIAYPGALDGIEINGVDITPTLTRGRIGALIGLRDSTLPGLTEQISQLAATLRDEINRVHNEGSGLPAAGTLTSSRAQSGTAVSFAGPLLVALVNTDGTEAFSATVAAPGTLDAAGYAAAIDAALGGFGGASASESGGVVTLSGGSYGVVLDGGTVDPGGGAPTTNVSDFLHLNDFFVGNDPTGLDQARVIGVRSDIVANPARLARGKLQQDPTTSAYYVSAGDNSAVQALFAKFSEPLDFAAAGGLPAISTTLGSYASALLSQNAVGAAGVADRLTTRQALLDELRYRSDSISGVNIDEELAKMVQLQYAYSASARLITVAAQMLETLDQLGR